MHFISILITVVVTVALLFVNTAFAARVVSKNISVVERNDMFITRTKAVLVGNYHHYVNRMLDVRNSKNMGLPYLVDVRLISETPRNKIVWSHIFTFPIREKYYSRVKINRGKKNTTLKYHLINRRGPYPNDHDFEHFSGEANVKHLSGSGRNSRFFLTSTTWVKFKPHVWDPGIIMKPKLRSHAESTLRAYSN